MTSQLHSSFARDALRIRAAWGAWALFAVIVVIVKFDDAPTAGNVFNIYREAAFRWQNGHDLYGADLYFNYFPTAALIFVPWTWLPFDVGGAVWRVINVGAFALGLWRLSEASEMRSFNQSTRSNFLIASIITIALCWSAARHGQMTLIMAGLMMLAVADIQRGAQWRAAIFASVAVALKPPAVVLLLVLAAVYPRFCWRAAFLCAVLALLPVLFQEPRYVLLQYELIPDMIQARLQSLWSFPNIFGMFTSLGWMTSELQQTLVRALVAIFVLLSCWRVKRRNPPPGVALYLYTLTSCYILLLGQGTEHNTYAMMGPVIGLVAATTWFAGRKSVFAAMCMLTMATLLSHTLMRTFPSYMLLSMIKPMVCSVLFVLVSWLSWNSGLSAGAEKDRLGQRAAPQRVIVK